MIAMPDAQSTVSDPSQILKEEFRRHLEIFYAHLKLAPPYESVEKSIRMLTTIVHALPKDEQVRIVSDPTLRWQQFAQAFMHQGLRRSIGGSLPAWPVPDQP